MTKIKTLHTILASSIVGLSGLIDASASNLQKYADQTDIALALSSSDGASNSSQSKTARCFPQITGAASAHVVVTYRGATKVDTSITTHSPRYMDVIVKATDKPAVLILESYEPVVWRLKVEPDAKIAGVSLRGYYEQMVDGLPQGTPLGRHFYTFREGSRPQPCYLASKKDAQKDQIHQAVESLDDLRQRARTLQQASRKSHNRVAALKNERKILNTVRLRLSSESADQKSVAIVEAMIEEGGIELKEAVKHLKDATPAMQDLMRKMQSHPNANRPPRLHRDRPLLSHYKSLRRTSLIPDLSKALEEQGDIALASYQNVNGNQVDLVTVSQRAATAFQQRRANGKAQLASLALPKLNLMPKGTKRGAPEKNMIGPDGVQSLVRQGYLVKSKQALDYYCQKLSATALSIGGFARRCGKHHGGTFTILGPIQFPEGLCGGNSVQFILPPKAPEPKGSPCHSTVLKLTDEPCLDDRGTCMSQALRRMRKR